MQHQRAFIPRDQDFVRPRMGDFGGFLADAFDAARTRPGYSARSVPPIYCDCGNTLFEKDQDGGVRVQDPMLNFLIALKRGGYDVRLMSDEPRLYKDGLFQALEERGLSARFFEDADEVSIALKGAIGSDPALFVIDNNHASHKINTGRFVWANDPDLAALLSDRYADFEKAQLPESCRLSGVKMGVVQRQAPGPAL